MKDGNITEIMSRQVHCLNANEDVIEAKRLMDEHHFNHLPIMMNDRVAGIISSNDIAQIDYLCEFIGSKLEASSVFQSLSIHEVMTKEVETLTADAKISDAILIFSNASFQSLPILEDGKLVGIVTTKDIFRFLSLI